jgi:hypothetical protein
MHPLAVPVAVLYFPRQLQIPPLHSFVGIDELVAGIRKAPGRWEVHVWMRRRWTTEGNAAGVLSAEFCFKYIKRKN